MKAETIYKIVDILIERTRKEPDLVWCAGYVQSMLMELRDEEIVWRTKDEVPKLNYVIYKMSTYLVELFLSIKGSNRKRHIEMLKHELYTVVGRSRNKHTEFDKDKVEGYKVYHAGKVISEVHRVVELHMEKNATRRFSGYVPSTRVSIVNAFEALDRLHRIYTRRGIFQALEEQLLTTKLGVNNE